MPSAGQSPARSGSRSEVARLLSLFKDGAPKAKPIRREQVRAAQSLLLGSMKPGSRISRQVAEELQRIEREYRLTSSARAEFQNLLGLLGIDSAFPIQVPANSEPCWLCYNHPLKQYRSRQRPPAEADIVIIGAGLTGASAAYHLRDVAAQGRRVMVLERGSPACEASGRNAGNFELLPENSVGTYEGFSRERLHFLRRCYPDIPLEVLRVEAERQASLVLSFAVRNRERLKQIIEQEKLQCDFSPKGWLYLAHTEREEQAICEEVALAHREQQQVEIWSRMKIRQEFGLENGFTGRFVPGDGTYHPAKFVYGVLELAVNGGVELYTHIAVKRVNERDGMPVIETSEGSITAQALIVATNAFTSQLLPELGAITPAQSQISLTEFAPDRCRGRVVTSEDGPVYFNQPRAGARDGFAPLLLGGGKDRPMRNPSSRRRSAKVHLELLKLRDRYFPELSRRPFSTEWIGPIALTPDQIPAMGFLRSGVVVAAGFNGYGGSYCVAAGQAAADMATSGTVPDWLPEDVFSPQRLLNQKALFFSETSSLWCYAASLCVQLREAHRELLEKLQSSRPSGRSSTDLRKTNRRINGSPKSIITAHALHGLRPFRALSSEECDEILAIARVRTASPGEVLVKQGTTGNCCLVILDGVVEVIHGLSAQKRMQRLGPASILGQITLIDGGCEHADCVAANHTTALELPHAACHQLLASRSQLAYKFLAALTEGVIQALRHAERQLKLLNGMGK